MERRFAAILAAARQRRTPQRGLALVTVLWVLMLLSLVAASFMATTRTEINLTRNLIENAKAEALADAGVYRAVYGLNENDPSNPWRVDGTVYAWVYGGGEIRVSVQDEGGKIDLNAASDELLRALLLTAEWAGPDGEVTDLDEAEADSLVDAIRDFIDEDDLRRLNGAEDEDYEAAGLSWDAKDAAFEAVEELQQVLGMTPAIYAAVSPALTVYSGMKAPHGATAPPQVEAALLGGARTGMEDGEPEPPETEDIELTDQPQILIDGPAIARSRVPVYAIHAEARLESGAIFVREVVVRVARDAVRPFAFHIWKRGNRRLFPETGQGG